MEQKAFPENSNVSEEVPETTMIQGVIQERREGLHQRLLAGATGAEVVTSFTDLVDAVLIARYRNVLRKESSVAGAALQSCCLVGVGGYGRRELAPYSDIDVMVLYSSSGEQVVSSLSSQVFQHLWDLGFQVGHSMRSIQDCLTIANEDISAKTALLESRCLTGNTNIFLEFKRRFAKTLLGRRAQGFIQEKVEERHQEYRKFGESIYLLEPNIKKTKGGLRDLHLLQWVGMAKYQAATLRQLADKGVLAHQDYLALVEAREFLWRVRALMHLHAGRAQDILTFEDQVRLAAQYGFSDQPHLLAVEQFMQQYYRHTTGLYDRCVRFIDRSRERGWWYQVTKFFPVPLIEGLFQIVNDRLTVPPEKLIQVLDDPEALLRLFRVAQEKRLPINSEFLEEIQRHLEGVAPDLFHTPSASQKFREILSGPGQVAEILELMHRARLLEKLIPAFARVRGLMQFNQYHKFTVDEHSLLAVKHCEWLGGREDMFGKVYQEIKHKDLLHLALLLHDLGKGLPEDHSEVGKAIAQKTTTRLGLNSQEGRTLEFLVHQHLLMAHTAFRRDPYDDKVLITFARAVGTPETLRKLYLLTGADIAAVGPETLTKWKESLLTELYVRTLPEVSGGRETAGDREHIKEIVVEVKQALGGRDGVEGHWVEEQLDQFPLRYCSSVAPSHIARHLQAIKDIQKGQPIVLPNFNSELKVCEYTLITYDDISPGIFMNATGVFAGQGLQVLDAQIITRNDGIVVDTFLVSDPDYVGEPPQDRLRSVGDSMISILKGEDTVGDLMNRCRRLSWQREFPFERMSTEVLIDNETSDHYTIIDIFAEDRQGLLYVMARSIFNLGLALLAARIATRLDQVVDVFYVTSQQGGKVDDPAWGEIIRNRLYQDVETFYQEGLDQP
jgi:[protein-PII] uridylyltransferase